MLISPNYTFIYCTSLIFLLTLQGLYAFVLPFFPHQHLTHCSMTKEKTIPGKDYCHVEAYSQ